MKEPSAAEYRIVHLSDLHLTARDADSRIEPKFTGRLRGMNVVFRRIARADVLQQANLVLVTGDVTDQGDLAAWELFRATLLNAGLLPRTLVVLGNHDVCGLAARLGWPRQLRQADLRRARQGLALCKQPTRCPWARRTDDRVVVFGLDTNNSGNYTAVTNAVGRIGFYQLAALANLLHKFRDVPVKIVIMHHSPNIPRRATALRRGRRPVSLLTRWLHQVPQEDRRCLRLLCLTHRVRLVLHGHLHSAEDRVVSGVRIVGAPAATEPAGQDVRGGSGGFSLCHYVIRGPALRLERRVLTLRPDDRKCGVDAP